MCSQAHSQQPPVTWDNCPPAFKYLASGAEHDSKLLPPLMLGKLIYKVQQQLLLRNSGWPKFSRFHITCYDGKQTRLPTPNNIN